MQLLMKRIEIYYTCNKIFGSGASNYELQYWKTGWHILLMILWLFI